jgi:hypothetical protein
MIETIVVCLTVLAGLALVGYIVLQIAERVAAKPERERLADLEQAIVNVELQRAKTHAELTARLDALKAPQNSKAAAAVTGGRIV